MELIFKIIGIVLIALGLIHVVFPRKFNWKNELSKLSLLNKQIMQVHTFFLALILVLLGLLTLTQTEALITTPLGQKLCLGIGFFWFVRLVFQFFVYSPKLWRGKPFETTVHVLFSCLWAGLSWAYLSVGLQL